jgi:hypothetical protein
MCMYGVFALTRAAFRVTVADAQRSRKSGPCVETVKLCVCVCVCKLLPRCCSFTHVHEEYLVMSEGVLQVFTAALTLAIT